MTDHAHVWEPCEVLGDPGRCCTCGYFEQIDKRHFRELFKMAFWRMKKANDDATLHGGYKGRLQLPGVLP
jgi:hypothetical protein